MNQMQFLVSSSFLNILQLFVPINTEQICTYSKNYKKDARKGAAARLRLLSLCVTGSLCQLSNMPWQHVNAKKTHLLLVNITSNCNITSKDFSVKTDVIRIRRRTTLC